MENKEFGSLDDIWCSLSEKEKKKLAEKLLYKVVNLEKENQALRDAYKRKGERK